MICVKGLFKNGGVCLKWREVNHWIHLSKRKSQDNWDHVFNVGSPGAVFSVGRDVSRLIMRSFALKAVSIQPYIPFLYLTVLVFNNVHRFFLNL